MIRVTTRLPITSETGFTLTLEPDWQIYAVGVDITNGVASGALVIIANGLAHAIAQREPLVTFTAIAIAFIDASGVLLTRGAKHTLVNIATRLPIAGETGLTLARESRALVDALGANTTNSFATCTLINVTNGLTRAILHLVTGVTFTFETVTLIDTRGIFWANGLLLALVRVATVLTIARETGHTSTLEPLLKIIAVCIGVAIGFASFALIGIASTGTLVVSVHHETMMTMTTVANGFVNALSISATISFAGGALISIAIRMACACFQVKVGFALTVVAASQINTIHIFGTGRLPTCTLIVIAIHLTGIVFAMITTDAETLVFNC